ncbi:xanthine dehydrogenase family protein molybdopterin-binding subunit [Chondromyces apiculatus]|uniref:Periplasmic aromatic aldehyde oxidoreductase, molybdenum binding subunit YagR n=1 Tax=Chondromyces apiculatus DSM 436 TaxID=1192034 RepID=A0A017T154_9BACT|nr:xanthine dehydrogenase family protein molybdopterin-binding subunit [Chondromyces apiculatus]EYF02958.1 Periplasmic aromatic aldehyde oxidoreductase, molybdenum binding subunit YagR [Chondromyces apiculatus DSM 436]
MADENGKVAVQTGLVFPGGSSLSEVERAVPSDEPPPWPLNAELSVVGKPFPRLDGPLKVTGAATYTADVRLPGMLHARVIRSPHPHARVKNIDVTAAERHPAARAVHVLEHMRGGAKLRDPKQETPSKFPIVRYVGQPIAAIAAATPADAEEVMRLVKVDYEVLPFVVDLEEARKPDAPRVFPGATEQPATAGGGGAVPNVPQQGNVRGPTKTGPLGPPRGDVEKGFEEAEITVENTFRTAVQTHSALETHGVVADWKPEVLTVYASTQGTSTVRDELAEVFGLPKGKIRVVTEFMGGGFGSKFGIGNFGVLAVHLSKKASAPVRLMLDRKEEHVNGGNRPSSVQRLRVGAKKDGSLTAIHLTSWGTGGTATGAGAGNVAKNMYACPNILIEESDVFTNAGPAAAFRAPGHPQGAFALEQVIDELAEKLGMDPLALRDKIDIDEDLGGRNVDSAARRMERKIGSQKFDWARRKPAGSDRGPVKRGLGVAQSIWYRFIDLDASCEVRLLRDGTVEVLSAVQDIGTGIRTALAQVVAEELGLQPKDITVRVGDTAFPAGVPSGGSRTTGSITPAARNAAHEVRRRFLADVAASMGARPEALSLKGGKVLLGDDGGRGIPFRSAAAKLKTEQITASRSRAHDYGGFAPGRPGMNMGIGGFGGVQFAEVTVDTETGIIKVERVVAVHDCGRPINPLALESQINGGILQGISYALYENRVLDRRAGVQLNPNFEQYKVLGAREVPAIEVLLLEEYQGRSSTDAGGIGEPATVPTAAALANAVYNATGVRMTELPMTPARVLTALAAARKGAQ